MYITVYSDNNIKIAGTIESIPFSDIDLFRKMMDVS